MKDIRITVLSFEGVAEGGIGKILEVHGGTELYDLIGDDESRARISKIEVWEGGNLIRSDNYVHNHTDVLDLYPAPDSPLSGYVPQPAPGQVYCQRCGYPPTRCICAPHLKTSAPVFCPGCGYTPSVCRCGPGTLANTFCTNCGFQHSQCTCAPPLVAATCQYCGKVPCNGTTIGCLPVTIKLPPATAPMCPYCGNSPCTGICQGCGKGGGTP